MKRFTLVFAVSYVGLVSWVSGATNLVIDSFDGSSGRIVFNEVENATNYYVLKSTALGAGWSSAGGGLDCIAPSGSGTIDCLVPVGGAEPICFFKVGADISIIQEALLNLVAITNGTLLMGNPDTLYSGGYDEEPVHEVVLDGFHVGKYEVTLAQWSSVRSWAVTNGYSFAVGSGKAADHPVHSVTWYDVVKWCNALSEKEGRTPCYTVSSNVYRSGSSLPDCDWSANGYRLPTEAEWEWAAKGASALVGFAWTDWWIDHEHANYEARKYSYYPADYDLTAYSTDYTYHPGYTNGVTPYTSPVGSFVPNTTGLYDMSGNVAEWCWDWYESDYYLNSPASNARGPSSGNYRVIRGGAWSREAYYCRTACRSYGSPGGAGNNVGFRVVRSVE